MQKFLASVLLVVLCVAAFTEAQRGGGRGGRRGGPGGNNQGGRGGPGGRRGPGGPGGAGGPGGRRGPGGMFPALANAEVYKWDVDTSDGTLIPQKGFVIPDKDAVAVITMSRELRGLNMTPSVIVMNPSTGVMIIKQAGRNTPCFLTSFGATKLELENDFSAWNDTTITLTQNLVLNGTGPAMSREDADVEFQNDPAVARVCRRGVIIPVTAMIGGVEDPDTVTLQLMGYDSQISLMVPQGLAQRGPGGRGGRPGGRGGRPGGRGGRPGGRLPGGLEGRIPSGIRDRIRGGIQDRIPGGLEGGRIPEGLEDKIRGEIRRRLQEKGRGQRPNNNQGQGQGSGNGPVRGDNGGQ